MTTTAIKALKDKIKEHDNCNWEIGDALLAECGPPDPMEGDDRLIEAAAAFDGSWLRL